MASWITDNLSYLMDRGGPVMWPLLVLSVVSVALVFERCWFWTRLNHPWRLHRVGQMLGFLHDHDLDQLTKLTSEDHTLYGHVASKLANRGGKLLSTEEVIQEYRGSMERFMPTLSTIISAAPMLGILGTVLGIISSFEALSDQVQVTDPRSVGRGIAESLVTTAFGLSIAIVVVFPFNAFRAQIDRTLTRIEALVSATASAKENSASN